MKLEKEKLIKKNKGVISRNKVLLNEIKNVKKEFDEMKNNYNKKSINDDNYISALKKLLKKMKKEQINLVSKRNKEFEYKENLNNLNHNKSKIDKILLENVKFQRKLAIKEDLIKKMSNNNKFFDSKNLNKVPLKENFVKKITLLNKRISELEQKNENLNQLCDIPLNNTQNLKNLSKENLKLRMKINQLEMKVYSSK